MNRPLPFSTQWYEGMLLSPHHFQYFCSGLQSAFESSLTAISDFCYGVNELKIDTSSLANGTIRILNLSGIFQDGTFFKFDVMKDNPLEKNLKSELERNSEAIKIYLGIIKDRVGENLLEGGNQRYYSSIEKDVNDTNTGTNPLSICILKPKLRLLIKEELDARYIYFPLLEISRSENNGINIVNYIPPMIMLDTHSKIVEITRNLVLDLRNKISFFADRKGNASFVLGSEIQSSLKVLIRATLTLEAIIKLDHIKPFMLYQYLLETTNFLASINVEQAIPTLPKYDHENLLDTFSKLIDFCKESLDYIKQPFITIPFIKNNNSFSLLVEKSWLQDKEFFISVKRKLSQSDNELSQWVEGVQIASESSISIVKDRRVLGANRRIIERGENIIPPKQSIMLAIDSQDPYILPSENLYIINPSDDIIVPEEVVFYVSK